MPTTTRPSPHTADRLTIADRERICSRIDHSVRLWTASAATASPKWGAADALALSRVGAAAIGCALMDLRAAEELFVVELAHKALGLDTPPTYETWNH